MCACRSSAWYARLWRDQQHVLQPPDVLVSAGGTRVAYRLAGGAWHADAQWARRLDADGRWDRRAALRAVRLAARAAQQLQDYHRHHEGDDGTQQGAAVVRLDAAGEQNAHRVRVLVRRRALEAFVAHLQAELVAASLDGAAAPEGYGPQQQQHSAAPLNGSALLPRHLQHQQQHGGGRQEATASGAAATTAALASRAPRPLPGAAALAAAPQQHAAWQAAAAVAEPPSSLAWEAAHCERGGGGAAAAGSLAWQLVVQPEGSVGLRAGWCAVDVIPAAAGQAAAVRHVMARFGVRADAEQLPVVLACGASKLGWSAAGACTHAVVLGGSGAAGGRGGADDASGGVRMVEVEGLWGPEGVLAGLSQLRLL